MRDLPRNIGAFSFGNGGTASVAIGTGVARLQNFDPVSIVQVCYPTTWPAAGLRTNFYINNGGTGFRQFGTSTDGGVNGMRILLDRQTADLNATATVGNIPYAAINKWMVLGVTVGTAFADSEQKLYGGDLQHALTPVTTYVTQTAGSGPVLTSDNVQGNFIGGTGTGGSYAGAIAITAVWNKYLTRGEIVQRQWMLLRGEIPKDAQGVWYTGAHGPLRAYDQTALHDSVLLKTSAHAVPSGVVMVRGFDLNRAVGPRIGKAGAGRRFLLARI